MSLGKSLALDELAQHLYPFLPGTPHPMADPRISFKGVARELGLGAYWAGGSKQPAIRRLLDGAIEGGTGQFSMLIIRVVERSITYRKRNNPLTREDIEQLNAALAKLGYKVSELHDRAFLDGLPRRDKPQ
jgi:hypothetical protein